MGRSRSTTQSRLSPTVSGLLSATRAHTIRRGSVRRSHVYAIGAQTATPTDAEGMPTAALTLRRLFYWTMRFFAESASKGHAMAQAALQRAFGAQLKVFVNWNLWVNIWYIPSPRPADFQLCQSRFRYSRRRVRLVYLRAAQCPHPLDGR